MAWKTDPVTQRAELMALMAQGTIAVRALCEVFTISRKTAYKWRRRYRAGGVRALVDRSRAAHRRPQTLAAATQAQLRALRARYPLFGPKKLRAMLRREAPERAVPAASTIGAFLRRAGLSQPRVRRARRRRGPWAPLHVMTGPNVVWTADFKGQFRLGDRTMCFPLTIADGYSRYLLRVQALRDVRGQPTRRIFDTAFREYGLPTVIRTDGGVPFCNLGPTALTRLSAWWIKLGIVPERIAPARPQQNGRHERMHRTLKAYVARPPRYDLAAQQRALDAFRDFFNTTRPHEALAMQTPAALYQPSPRRYDGQVPVPSYPGHFEQRRVHPRGEIGWRGQRLFVSEALIGDPIGLEEIADGVWQLHFGPVRLGHILDAALHLGLIPLHAPWPRRVSPMSPV